MTNPISGNAPRTVRAVFFDAGFTLIFPRRPIVEIYLEAAKEVSQGHCEIRLKDAFHRAWSEGTRHDVGDHRSSDVIERARWHRFTRRVAEAIPELLPHHDAWLDRLTATFDSAHGWMLAPDATSVLREIRARGLTIGIVSNWHAGLQQIIDDVGLTPLVDFVVCSADIGYRKPHPEIFHEALRRSGADASSVLHVGDTWAEDVVGAAAVGIAAVHLTNGAVDRSGVPHHAIASLSEIHALLGPASK